MDVSPEALDFLRNYVARGEAPTYNTVYGGGKFSDYSDHPGVSKVITSGPNAGKTSSAAGLYQFLQSTWKDEQKRLGLPDFSPRSQDLAAYDLAARTYRAKTGRGLDADLKAKGRDIWDQAGRALSGVWTSLPGGIESFGRGLRDKANTMYAQRQLAQLDPLRNAGAAGPARGAPAAPPPDPLADSFAQAMQAFQKPAAAAKPAVAYATPVADAMAGAMQPRNLILGGASGSFGSGV